MVLSPKRFPTDQRYGGQKLPLYSEAKHLFKRRGAVEKTQDKDRSWDAGHHTSPIGSVPNALPNPPKGYSRNYCNYQAGPKHKSRVHNVSPVLGTSFCHFLAIYYNFILIMSQVLLGRSHKHAKLQFGVFKKLVLK